MMTDFDKEWAVETLAVRAGQVRTAENEHSEPIFATSSYVFDTAAEAAARFKGELPGNIYSRFTNPTVRTFEQRLAAMEGGESCVATASGMSAILSTCLALLQQGDHIVSSRSIFGTSVVLFDKYLGKTGIATSYVPLTDLSAWENAIRPETKMLFLETPSNPLSEVANIQALASLARAHDCLLVVDNCFCTPVLQQPLKLGANIVIHSATKYIDGQGRCIGGAVVGDSKLVGEEVYGFLRTAGPTLSPFNAWVFLKGLETLNVRMKAHSDNASQLAEYLQQHPNVSQVFYAGLSEHPQHELAARQQSGYGGVLAFEVKGGQKAAWNLIDNTRLLSITANLGDAKTTITHPASTTHGRLSDEQRAESGITPGLVRVAVGLENVGDIITDLERGLK
ncbi:O-succinylhomoserine sulfhydrylase [Thiohalophilus sp.]|uniref:O-succinylhomoserine sulfhydrylase n=1 Tax=Thiohalophilus sp. TaxID=3028392 RepID=UPI003976B0CB